MGATRTDVALALLGARQPGVAGDELVRVLHGAGRRTSPAKLMTHLLELERSGHVHVDRGDQYRFRLTPAGEALAYEVGPGAPLACTLVMVDLVGYVAFTAREGDEAAHAVSRELRALGESELRRVGGRIVKFLGDGFLACVVPTLDAVAVVRHIAAGCQEIAGGPWSLRGAVHRGQPIEHQGDLFGGDVNLVSRLCDAAGPDEILVSAPADAPGVERIEVRGLATATPVHRVALR